MTNINVIQYVQNLKSESINSIRLLEVDISRKFDEMLYILEQLTNKNQLPEESEDNAEH